MKNRKGFTLIEMIFVLMIIAFLTSAAALSFIRNREMQNLKDGVQIVVDQITDARNRAVAGWSVPKNKTIVDPVADDTVLPERLGVWFDFQDRQRVVLFADLNGDKKLAVADDFVIDNLVATELWEGVGVWNLPGDVNLQRIYGGVGNNKKEYLQAYFFYEVPTGEVYLRGATDAAGSVWDDNLDWLRVDLGLGTEVTELGESEMRKVAVNKVGGYPYICSAVEVYNDSNLACF